MSRQLKAAILIAIVFDDLWSQEMVQAEADRNDPVIDVRHDMALATVAQGGTF